MNIKLSIIVPIHNSEKFLSACLKSICLQINQNTEVILVNDASTDDSLKICKKFEKKFSFVKLINLKINLGVGYARNIGIDSSLGEYLCFVDSDDLLLKGTINNIHRNIKSFNETDIFILKNLNLKNKSIKKSEIDQTQKFNPLIKDEKSIVNFTKNFYEFRATCWNFIVKKSFLYFNDISFKKIKVAEDWVFVSQIICLANNFKLIKEPGYVHRMTEIDTLGKNIGYTLVISHIKVIYELGKFFNLYKYLLNDQKIRYLIKISNYAAEGIFSNIIICNKNEIKKISNLMKIYRTEFLILSEYGLKNFNFLLKKNIDFYFTQYKSKKNMVVKKKINKIRNKQIILFCVGKYGRSVLKNLIVLGAKVSTLIDNNKLFIDQKLENLRINSPTFLKKNLKKYTNHKIFVCNQQPGVFYKIKKQLLKIGIKNKNIFNFNIM